MAKRKWYKFQVLLQYLVGSPHGLDRVHTLGVVTIDIDNARTIDGLARKAVEKILNGQPYLRELINVGGAKVWAKAID